MIKLIQDYIDNRRLAIAAGYLPMPSSACDIHIMCNLAADLLPVSSGWLRGAA